MLEEEVGGLKLLWLTAYTRPRSSGTLLSCGKGCKYKLGHKGWRW